MPDDRFVFPKDGLNLKTYQNRDVSQPWPEAEEKIAGLFGAFKGKRCFIIGNGPSLNRHDLGLLEGEHVFAVNSFFYKTDETGFRPSFYVVEDNKVMAENLERIVAYEAPYKFFPTEYRDLHPHNENVYFFRMDQGFYNASSPNFCTPRFSADASSIIYCGQTVTYVNLQLAFFMGFTEVYLIGMDFDYVIPKEHLRQGNHIISTTDDPNHFHKDYFGKGKTWKDPKLDRVAMNYRQAKLSYEAVGRKIYNATIGGKLEIFDRVDYDALLRDPATGKKRREPASPITLLAGRGDAPVTPLVSSSELEPADQLVRAATGGSPEEEAPSDRMGRVSADGPLPAGARAPLPISPRPNSPASLASEAYAPVATNAASSPSRKRMRASVGRLAVRLKAKAPTLFRLGQMTTWSLRAARRRKFAALLLLVVCAALVGLPFGYPPAWGWRAGLWLGAVLLLAAAGAAAVLREALRRISIFQETALASAVRSARQTQERRIGQIEKRIVGHREELDRRTRALELDGEKTAKHRQAEIARLSAGLEKALRLSRAGDHELKTAIEQTRDAGDVAAKTLKAEIVGMFDSEKAQIERLEENFAQRANRAWMENEKIKAAIEQIEAANNAVDSQFTQEIAEVAESMRARIARLEEEIAAVAESTRAGNEELRAATGSLREDLLNMLKADIREAGRAAETKSRHNLDLVRDSMDETLRATLVTVADAIEAGDEAVRADLQALRLGIDQRLGAEIAERLEELAATLKAKMASEFQHALDGKITEATEVRNAEVARVAAEMVETSRATEASLRETMDAIRKDSDEALTSNVLNLKEALTSGHMQIKKELDAHKASERAGEFALKAAFGRILKSFKSSESEIDLDIENRDLMRFKMIHHLVDDRNKIIYCYVAKSGCTTIKSHFNFKKAMEGYSIDSPKIQYDDIHQQVKRYQLRDIPLDLFEDYYAFCVVRHPFERVASAFLDKFIRQEPRPHYADLLMKNGAAKAADEWTFSDFVRAISTSDVRFLNEHWMPQYQHLISGISYELIPLEALSHHERLRGLYGDLSVSVGQHALRYDNSIESAHLTPISELKSVFRETGLMPNWRALVRPPLEPELMRVYGPDFDLYERARASQSAIPTGQKSDVARAPKSRHRKTGRAIAQ